jgi:MFS family permease
LRSPSPRALLATASAAVALAAADTYVVVLALPDMMAGVGLGIEALQRAAPIISGFLLGYVAVLPLIGRVADLVSRQRILLVCLGLFVAGSVVTASAVDLPVLVSGRVLQGIGGGGLVPATLALVADLWPVDRRGTALGIVGGVQELGSVLGPLVGALILAVSDWRTIFWLNVVLGIVLAGGIVITGREGIRLRVLPVVLAVVAGALGVLTLLAPERLVTDITLGVPFIPFHDDSRVATPIGVAAGVVLLVFLAVTARSWGRVLLQADLAGAVCLAVALGCLVLTFSSADPERSVVGPLGWWLVPVGLVAVGLYLWRHRAASSPLIARGLVQARVIPALVVSVLVGCALVAVVVDVPLLARLVMTDSQTTAALVLVRFLVAVPIGAVAGGWLLRRCGAGLVAGPGLLAAAGGMFAMSRWDEGSLEHWSATLVLVVVGLGLGLAIAPVNDAALADAPQEAHGMASALVVVGRMVGMVVGLALLTAIGLHRFYAAVDALRDPQAPGAMTHAGVVQVQTVFFGAAVAALLAALVSLSLGLRRREHEITSDEGPALVTGAL